MSYRQIMEYLKAHPTPWRLVFQTEPPVSEELRASLLNGEYDEVRCAKGEPGRDIIVDAEGNPVVETWDGESYASGLQGDVRALVDFVNMVGEEHEPPCGWHTAYVPEEAEGGDGEDRRFSTRSDEEFLRRLGYTPPGSSDEN